MAANAARNAAVERLSFTHRGRTFGPQPGEGGKLMTAQPQKAATGDATPGTYGGGRSKAWGKFSPDYKTGKTQTVPTERQQRNMA